MFFYGTLEGYLKAVDAPTEHELYRFKMPSGIVGNLNSYQHNGNQFLPVLSDLWLGKYWSDQ